jgi:DNA-directed RNA polymerase specialized sigma24 family protein
MVNRSLPHDGLMLRVSERTAVDGRVVPNDTRLDADRRRAEALRALGQDHDRFIEYGLNLRDYGINTLIKQWRTGELRPIVHHKTRIKLPPPPSSWLDDDVSGLIAEAVIRSVEPFMQSAILQGGWQPEGGASIKTYFIGSCYFTFATDYRREYRAEMKASKMLERKKLDLELDVIRYVHHTVGRGPEQTALNRAEIRRLLALATHTRIPEIVFLLADGMTSNEVGAALGMTSNAVDQALKKFRLDVSRAYGRKR